MQYIRRALDSAIEFIPHRPILVKNGAEWLRRTSLARNWHGNLACISHPSGSWFSCIDGFREILRFALNDNLKQCVILRGGGCPEESLRGFEEEEIFQADDIAASEKCGLDCLGGFRRHGDRGGISGRHARAALLMHMRRSHERIEERVRHKRR